MPHSTQDGILHLLRKHASGAHIDEYVNTRRETPQCCHYHCHDHVCEWCWTVRNIPLQPFSHPVYSCYIVFFTYECTQLLYNFDQFVTMTVDMFGEIVFSSLCLEPVTWAKFHQVLPSVRPFWQCCGEFKAVVCHRDLVTCDKD